MVSALIDYLVYFMACKATKVTNNKMHKGHTLYMMYTNEMSVMSSNSAC